MGTKSFTEDEYERSREYLLKAMDNVPSEDAAGVPPILRLVAHVYLNFRKYFHGLLGSFHLVPCRLLGVLFRLLRMQVITRVGSAQLTEDMLWVFVRLTLTYFSFNNFGADGRLEDLLVSRLSFLFGYDLRHSCTLFWLKCLKHDNCLIA